MARRVDDLVTKALHERWKPVRKQALRDHGKLAEWNERMHWHRRNDVPQPNWEDAARAADLEFPDVLGALWVEMEKLRPQIEAKVVGDKELSRLRDQLAGDARRVKEQVARAKTKVARERLKAESEEVEGGVDESGLVEHAFMVPEHWLGKTGEVTKADGAWALHHVAIPNVKPEEAPSGAAWGLLQMGRDDIKVLQPYAVPDKKPEAVSDRIGDDAGDLLESLGEFLRSRWRVV